MTMKNKLPTALLLAIIGMALLGLFQLGSMVPAGGKAFLPLLAQLAICEFGFFVCGIGAFLGCKADWGNCRPSINSIAAMVCFILALYFAFTGFQLWPQ
jgi:hypothetical protein